MEVFVVMFLMAILTTLVLANYHGFNRIGALERGAQLVALLLRDAESRAISVRATSGAFKRSFGLHIDKDLNSRRYIIFADVNDSNFFESASDATLDARLLDPQVRVSRLCANLKGTSAKVPPLSPNCDYSQLSITFARPSPTVTVFGKVGVSPAGDLEQGDFEIELETNDTLIKRCVVVWTTGAVSIESNKCL